ncbi:MAG: hypothetical protein L0Z62_26645 [Gemmataceae bacterium]|nr:hypothetical protein [Gemmataceae bacterium]
MDHRGRVQAQGGGVEIAESWDQDDPLLASEGHTKLDRLKSRLIPAEQKHREEAFREAHEFVDRAAATGVGACANTRKSFPRKPRRDHRRVDIEVHKGRAFVPDPPPNPEQQHGEQ